MSTEEQSDLFYTAKPWHTKPTYNTTNIIDIISTKFGLTREQLIDTEIVETAILKRAVSIDPELAKQITSKDIEGVTGNASWFSGDYINLPGYLVVAYRSLNHAQRDAICETYRGHYVLSGVRYDNLNNLIFFPMSDFLTKILDTLSV